MDLQGPSRTTHFLKESPKNLDITGFLWRNSDSFKSTGFPWWKKCEKKLQSTSATFPEAVLTKLVSVLIAWGGLVNSNSDNVFLKCTWFSDSWACVWFLVGFCTSGFNTNFIFNQYSDFRTLFDLLWIDNALEKWNWIWEVSSEPKTSN